MTEPLEVGVLGYRFMGKAHANAMARLPMFFPDAPDVSRSVLVGRDEDALEEAADRLGFDSISTDWEAVVDDVDVFYNLGPNHVHPEPSIAALEAGTPVFCEKPLAPTLDDAERMADAAAEAGVPAGTAFNYRFVPAIQYAKALLEDGELGEIRHVHGRYLQDWLVDPDAPWSWRLDEELAGSGVLGDLGAHTVDLVRFLVGDDDLAGDIERLSGHLQTFVDERPVEDGSAETPEESRGDGDAVETRPVTVDDAYSAQLEFANGAVGTLEGSRYATGHKNDHTIEIHGSQGSLRFSLERLNELEVHRESDRGYETILVTDADDPYVDHWWPPGHVIGWEHTFVHENYEFLAAVAGSEASQTPRNEDGETAGEDGEFEPNFADGLAAQRVLERVVESDERGEWLTLE
ncbi:Gfo/Idh/MocA family protein [Natronobacterium gregoryi]|uniref:Dehydrogenase n=2 Tax=Natronobacterium gregoryi TaxID=44930 RepID=L0AJG4_NATGS|nr:Gfo/Idh/MocA family oxidoreductase [Natronobacterium gregoryi]AFZ73317.1 putative dehydrogenase [Natronobacterium gregoryi SP2]ELY73879.1 oxidoreductase domain-containing protein [Natronobacterium gregoryi SP2]PLK19893.1 gfo/Idh/MocA family oxidoreductase [Natronobacterium gregoryi SP2]SFJ37526.1 Predicted dehydrogenase [Natronobacterium gregoryi]